MYELRFDPIDNFFLSNKIRARTYYEFTRICVTKRFRNNSRVMFSNQFACVHTLLVKYRTDCPPLLRRFSIARMHIMAYIHTKEYTLEYYVHRDKNNESR